MSEPRTDFDGRYSAPRAAAGAWTEAEADLRSAELYWLTTVRADGRPHVTPLVAVWADSVLYFCTGEAEQKAINLSANPHVVLTTGGNGWEDGLDVMVEGDAVRVSDEDTLQRLAGAWTTKWDGRWHFEVQDGSFRNPGSAEPVLVFAVAPAKILAFTKGTFSQTRYRF
jgi:general stress protein 26